jgi:hypothetical protein
LTQVLDTHTLVLDGFSALPASVGTKGWVDARVLAAATAEAHTVPTGAKRVLFSANCDFFALFNATAAAGTAATPAADITDGTSPELNPVVRDLSGVAEISLISAAGGIVTMRFFR